VDVVLIGGKTCGKPYGFTAKDNCGISYFPIEFSGVNDQGFGDYADGFEPTASGTAGTRFVKGCTVADDTGHALGDPSEAMLASALGHVDRGSCPPAQPSARCARRTRSAAKAAAPDAAAQPGAQQPPAVAALGSVRRGRESRPDRVHPAQQCQRLGMRHARALDQPARMQACASAISPSKPLTRRAPRCAPAAPCA
jgi:hypothetical protein